MDKECEHHWVEKERSERTKDLVVTPGLFGGTTWTKEMRILQECDKCGIYNTVTF